MRKSLWIIVLVVLFGGGICGQMALMERRPVHGPTLESGVLAAVGGLRALAAEVIWFRAERLQDEGRYLELAQLAHLLTTMDPHEPEVWSYAAWNLAYNIAIMMPTPEDRWRWVEAAISLLRDRGLKLNPEEAELYRELAFLFEVKMGTNLDIAAEIYRQKWREIMTQTMAKGDWASLGYDYARLLEVENKYGLTDWKSPFFSAVYWASSGLPYAKGKQKSFLMEIIRQSCVMAQREKEGLLPYSPKRAEKGKAK